MRRCRLFAEDLLRRYTVHDRQRRVLRVALTINVAMFAVELVGPG